jgi:UPF0755 protein
MAENTKKPKQKKHKRSRALPILALLVILVAIGLVCMIFSYGYVMKSYEESSESKQVVIREGEGKEFQIPKGANTAQIAELLKKEGFISNVGIYKLFSKLNGYDGRYQSGIHIVSKSLSLDEMMRVLTSNPESKKVTIPEGKTFLQIVDILYDNKVISSKEDFIKAANTGTYDYAFLKGLGERDNKLEGYLFPDTYQFEMNTSSEEIISMMLDNFDKKFKSSYKERVTKLKGMTEDKIIILASIIEREAKTPDDRDKISGVFYNRLNSKDKTLRKLQSCATIQYILLKTTGSVKEKLYNKDLAIDDRYNTYMYEGLPPGPICCPGEEAIKAALYPDDNKYLYFVAQSDGTHLFSETFSEHKDARLAGQ